jgi:hypothetical protein
VERDREMEREGQGEMTQSERQRVARERHGAGQKDEGGIRGRLVSVDWSDGLLHESFLCSCMRFGDLQFEFSRNMVAWGGGVRGRE